MAKKKNNATTFFIAIIFVLSVIGVFYTNMNKNTDGIKNLSDGSVDWKNVEMVTISSDGYFGREIDEEIVIADKDEVKKLVNAATDFDEYEVVPKEERLEGICGIFVDFGNGCVFSMYEDENYGTIGNEKQQVRNDDGDYYKFPEKLRTEVISVLSENAK